MSSTNNYNNFVACLGIYNALLQGGDERVLIEKFYWKDKNACITVNDTDSFGVLKKTILFTTFFEGSAAW